MTNILSIAVHAFASHMLMSFLVDEMCNIPIYEYVKRT